MAKGSCLPCVRRTLSENKKFSGRRMGELTVRESLLPCVMVTTLFFLWGFAYGLLDVLNAHFQQVLGISKGQSSGLQGAYFGAYFITPIVLSGNVLRRWGSKVTFMTGLSIFGVGCLLFWPSGVYYSFGGFCGSMFVVGCGLSTLETSANPFIAVCGPSKYTEIRLNISQSIQAIGTVMAPVLAAHVFFKNTTSKASLQNVQWVYLAVGILVFCLAFAFAFAPIPELTDADMQSQVDEEENLDVAPLRKQITLFWGVFAQFCYVGSQVAVAGYFINYCLETGRSAATSSNLLAVAQAQFAIGRFSASFSMNFVKPRKVLLVAVAMCAAFSVSGMNTHGTAGIVLMNFVFFFEACCFPTIFTLALKKLGRHTTRGASFLVSAVSGGAVFPPILGAVADRKGTHFAILIPFIGYCLAITFPIYVNIFQRKRIDIAASPVPKLDLDTKIGGLKTAGLELPQRPSNGTPDVERGSADREGGVEEGNGGVEPVPQASEGTGNIAPGTGHSEGGADLEQNDGQR